MSCSLRFSVHMYYPLLYHSNYGLGGSDFRTLFEALKEYRIDTCAIVDGTLFGLNEFLRYAREYKIKPIIGSRIRVSSSSPAFIYLFIKSQTGYKNLCQILTRYALKNLDLEFLKLHAEGLVLVSNSIKLIEELSSAFSEIYFLLLPNSSVLPQKRIPIICANEIFYVHRKERLIYRLLSVIKKFKPDDTRNMPYYLLSPKSFKKFYTHHPEAFKNLLRLSKICDYTPAPAQWVFPQMKRTLKEIIKIKYDRLHWEEKRRLAFEYRIIKEMGFEPYFVLVYELKEFAKEKGIGMNVRGSAASSFILYLLGISIVNPLKYNLPFERFLNQKRSEPPDIDVDVEYNQRERLISEVYKKFGGDYVARISMVNRFQTKARFRDTARAYGISPLELKNLKELFGERLIKDIANLSARIDNYPHYFSCHPSGIVITPEPVFNYVPLYPSPQGAITQFDKDGISIAGLVKIDILGVRGFPELYLKKEGINFNDQSVYRFIAEAKTIGCFQIESPMVRQVLKRIKPKNLMDIANAIAIIRPGPAHGGMKEKFLGRLDGKEAINFIHPVLDEILKETLGIPVYQEQILNMANRFAGFSLEDADLLRRAITKERNTDLINKIKDDFYKHASILGYTTKEIEAVWKRISAFSSFGFNKAHSITYATLAYLSAYQKLYNPLEFFCRLLNNGGGYYPFYAYINEARRWGIKILGPDLNQSDYGFSIKRGYLQTGFNAIKNLSLPTIKKMMKLRPFKSVTQFFLQVHPNVKEGICLIKSGALDLFGLSMPELYFLLLQSSSYAHQGSDTIVQQNLIKEGLPGKYFLDFTQRQKLEHQLSVLNFLPGQHILEFLYPKRKIRIADITQKPNINGLIGLVIAKRTILTQTRKFLSFFSIDDETGVLDTMLFPGQYQIAPSMQIIRIPYLHCKEKHIIDYAQCAG
ncbi:MAG: helix-hairpin-helix domain-containing protein [bacterium]